MSTSGSSTVELFVAAYGTEGGAGAALTAFKTAHREGAIDLIDAAVIVHSTEGKVKFEETADPSQAGDLGVAILRDYRREPSDTSPALSTDRGKCKFA